MRARTVADASGKREGGGGTHRRIQIPAHEPRVLNQPILREREGEGGRGEKGRRLREKLPPRQPNEQNSAHLGIRQQRVHLRRQLLLPLQQLVQLFGEGFVRAAAKGRAARRSERGHGPKCATRVSTAHASRACGLSPPSWSAPDAAPPRSAISSQRSHMHTAAHSVGSGPEGGPPPGVSPMPPNDASSFRGGGFRLEPGHARLDSLNDGGSLVLGGGGVGGYGGEAFPPFGLFGQGISQGAACARARVWLRRCPCPARSLVPHTLWQPLQHCRACISPVGGPRR